MFCAKIRKISNHFFPVKISIFTTKKKKNLYIAWASFRNECQKKKKKKKKKKSEYAQDRQNQVVTSTQNFPAVANSAIGMNTRAETQPGFNP